MVAACAVAIFEETDRFPTWLLVANSTPELMQRLTAEFKGSRELQELLGPMRDKCGDFQIEEEPATRRWLLHWGQ